MKISFLGAGAIGSMLAALLKQHAPELDVLVVVRGAHGEAIAERGQISIVGPWGRAKVPIAWSFDPRDVAGSDIVFVTVKSQDTRDALLSAGDALDEAIVVSIQNGINEPEYETLVPSERLVMGMTATNMAVVEPGVVSLQLGGVTLFGPSVSDAKPATVRKVVDLLGRIKVPQLTFASHPNLTGIRYTKLTINALGYASCLSASNFMTEALGYRPWRNCVGRAIIRECNEILRQSGIQLASIPGGSDLSRIEKLMLALDLPIIGKLVHRGIRGKFERSPIVFSLFQDLERGKATEIDHINGQFVRLAASVGAKAPVNAELVRMTHELEQQPPATFYSRQEVIDRISQVSAPGNP